MRRSFLKKLRRVVPGTSRCSSARLAAVPGRIETTDAEQNSLGHRLVVSNTDAINSTPNNLRRPRIAPDNIHYIALAWDSSKGLGADDVVLPKLDIRSTQASINPHVEYNVGNRQVVYHVKLRCATNARCIRIHRPPDRIVMRGCGARTMHVAYKPRYATSKSPELRTSCPTDSRSCRSSNSCASHTPAPCRGHQNSQ